MTGALEPTKREGYLNKRVNHSWRPKDSPRLQANFYRKGNLTTRDNFMRDYSQRETINCNGPHTINAANVGSLRFLSMVLAMRLNV